MKALILAAGKGTRLKELTKELPKPMLTIGDSPLLEQLVLWLRSHGVTEIAMNLHHAPDAIRGYFGDGSRFGLSIVYSYEPELLGTAGAAKRLEWFLNEPFVVVYGDLFTNVDLGRLVAFHEAQKQRLAALAAATLALYQVPNPTECGLVDVDEAGRIQRFVEKPPADQVFTDLANAGVVICDPQVLGYVPPHTVYDFGRELFPLLLSVGFPLFGLPISAQEFLVDIGTPRGYAQAQQLWATHAPAPAA